MSFPEDNLNAEFHFLKDQVRISEGETSLVLTTKQFEGLVGIYYSERNLFESSSAK